MNGLFRGHGLGMPGRRAALCRALGLLGGVGPALSACAPIGPPGAAAAAPADYAATVRDALAAYASDLQGYTFRATPVGNFGVGSIYLEDIGDPSLARVDSAWYLGGPDAWLPAAAPRRAAVLARMVAEGSLGGFALSSSRARTLDARASVSILLALTASASLDMRKGVETTLQATDVRNRRLDWAEFENALDAGLVDPAVAKVVRTGRFVVAAADVVLTGYRAEVAVDERVNPALAASLRSNALLPQLRGGRAQFSVSESGQGRFVAAARDPVVAAVLYKRPPPQSKAFAPGDRRPSIERWPSVAIDAGVLESVDQRVLEKRR